MAGALLSLSPLPPHRWTLSGACRLPSTLSAISTRSTGSPRRGCPRSPGTRMTRNSWTSSYGPPFPPTGLASTVRGIVEASEPPRRPEWTPPKPSGIGVIGPSAPVADVFTPFPEEATAPAGVQLGFSRWCWVHGSSARRARYLIPLLWGRGGMRRPGFPPLARGLGLPAHALGPAGERRPRRDSHPRQLSGSSGCWNTSRFGTLDECSQGN
jgi:hypothetical protein